MVSGSYLNFECIEVLIMCQLVVSCFCSDEEVVVVLSSPEVVEVPPSSPEVVEVPPPPPQRRGPRIKQG